MIGPIDKGRPDGIARRMSIAWQAQLDSIEATESGLESAGSSRRATTSDPPPGG